MFLDANVMIICLLNLNIRLEMSMKPIYFHLNGHILSNRKFRSASMNHSD